MDQVTRWDAVEVVDGFASADARLWWRLGYEHLPGLLDLDRASTVLDVGCGTGAITGWIAGHGVEAVGVDSSPPMIEAARAQAAANTAFHLRDGARTQLPAASVDAAWAAFVFVCLPDVAAMRRVAAEMARVVRPGGRIAVLDSHPDTTGVDFTDLVQGEPGVRYRAGDALPVWLRRLDGTWESFTDTYWDRATYAEVLAGAGFTAITCHSPVFDEPEQARWWPAALDRPPFLLVSARRAGPPISGAPRAPGRPAWPGAPGPSRRPGAAGCGS